MAQITPEDQIVYTDGNRVARPVSYDDEQHSGAILWMAIVVVAMIVCVVLPGIVYLVITGRIG